MGRTFIPLLAIALGCSPRTQTLSLQAPQPSIQTAKAPPAPKVEVLDRGGVRNVRVLLGETWVQVTRFTRPEHIYEAAVSPSTRWLLVWHMARSPRVLSIYDLRTLELHHEWSPGFGGNLHWTAEDTIFHRWGAGTSCRCWAIYSNEGRVVNQGVIDDLEVSPDRSLAVLFPTMMVTDRSIVLLDLGCGRSQNVARLGETEFVLGARWRDPRTAVLDVGTWEDERRTIEIAIPSDFLTK